MRIAIVATIALVLGTGCGQSTTESSTRSSLLAADCVSSKTQHCVEEMGLDDPTCRAKADAWCRDTWDCYSAKFEYCVDELGLDRATCKEKCAAWCSDSHAK